MSASSSIRAFKTFKYERAICWAGERSRPPEREIEFKISREFSAMCPSVCGPLGVSEAVIKSCGPRRAARAISCWVGAILEVRRRGCCEAPRAGCPTRGLCKKWQR